MKKFSIYNYWYKTRKHVLLYNAYSDDVLVLLPSIADLIKKQMSEIEQLSEIHPQLYQTLLCKQMIVDEDVDESEKVIEQWKSEDNAMNTFSITINPTMDCNLRCWYCYENHCKASVMDEGTKNGIMKLIARKANDNNLECLSIDFFGGEPFLAFSEVIQPIVAYAKQLCDENNKMLNVSATTNGVLLSAEMMNSLCGVLTNTPIQLQITLDGSREYHDHTRKTYLGEPTYDIILQNIKHCLAIGVHVTVRFNYTQKNAHTFVDVIQDFQDVTIEQRRFLTFTFHKVWQDCRVNAVEETIENTKDIFEKEGFRILQSPQIMKSRCYADKINHIVVNYNGGIYKCTARDFTEKNSEGFINDSGDIIPNERYLRRMEIVYGNKTCRKCRIFPICHGGCSQDKLEHQNKGCIRGYSQQNIDNILERRVLYFLKEENFIK